MIDALRIGDMEMTAHYLMIEGKHRQMVGFHASLADFSVTQGEESSADILLTTVTY
jgi:hypothetical protein